jgi:1,4-alpha-glucan branching enzyme
MAVNKRYSKDKKACRVTFTLPKEISENFEEICVDGDFNNWDIHQHKFSHKNSDGSSSIELVLESGNEYQFRYLCNGETWLNEPEADKQNPTYYGDSKNSVIII